MSAVDAPRAATPMPTPTDQVPRRTRLTPMRVLLHAFLITFGLWRADTQSENFGYSWRSMSPL